MVKSKKNILLVLHYCMVLALLVCCHNGRASSGESRIDEINRLAAERRRLEGDLRGDKLNKFVAASDRPYKVSNSVHDFEEETVSDLEEETESDLEEETVSDLEEEDNRRRLESQLSRRRKNEINKWVFQFEWAEFFSRFEEERTKSFFDKFCKLNSSKRLDLSADVNESENDKRIDEYHAFLTIEWLKLSAYLKKNEMELPVHELERSQSIRHVVGKECLTRDFPTEKVFGEGDKDLGKILMKELEKSNLLLQDTLEFLRQLKGRLQNKEPLSYTEFKKLEEDYRSNTHKISCCRKPVMDRAFEIKHALSDILCFKKSQPLLYNERFAYLMQLKKAVGPALRQENEVNGRIGEVQGQIRQQLSRLKRLPIAFCHTVPIVGKTTDIHS